VQEFAGLFPKVELLGDDDLQEVAGPQKAEKRAPSRQDRSLGKAPLLANIERKVLFSFSRAAALVVIVLLATGVLLTTIGTWGVYSTHPSAEVSYDDIKTKLAASPGEHNSKALGDEDVLGSWPGPGLSSHVRGVFAGSDNESNRAFLARRLSLVDASARRSISTTSLR
jgi:hypothetical protein